MSSLYIIEDVLYNLSGILSVQRAVIRCAGAHEKLRRLELFGQRVKSWYGYNEQTALEKKQEYVIGTPE